MQFENGRSLSMPIAHILFLKSMPLWLLPPGSHCAHNFSFLVISCQMRSAQIHLYLAQQPVLVLQPPWIQVIRRVRSS